jgi:large subunit ribosomal protein L21
MYAIIEQSGSQRKVTQGEEILVDLVSDGTAKAGDSLTFDRVLLLGRTEGDAAIGRPYVKGASVTAEVVLPDVLGEKLVIQKFRNRTGYKRKTGHRQRYTKVRVTAING